jgi:hypothetical protein
MLDVLTKQSTMQTQNRNVHTAGSIVRIIDGKTLDQGACINGTIVSNQCYSQF